MDIRIAGIYIWQGKAYVPTYGRVVGGGPFVEIEPVFTVELVKDQMVRVIKSALAAGHPPAPNLSAQERDRRVSPILVATGARNWSDLYRKAVTYTIEWGPNGVFLEHSRRAPKGGWEFDPEKRQQFAPDTSIEDIVDVILHDIEARSVSRRKPSQK